ncbi:MULTISPECIES: DUF4160 domain-containing protein [Rhizobium]|uniref:DUF4160 domain-containing protein n=1 Tax=Rhizobium TaxID=379 RepID=UPI001030EF80|nr:MULTISPECIES: DUF4160 domain-containing protein [Rhizobium]MBY4615714.1 DUF4160 domain-containing protein [Rhizobium redzepovicii]TAY75190.1 DUF4160 domain-containing protein [Rhizobium ruizarguesonis]
MPVVVKFGNVKIHVYANDHNPPHFHVSTPDHDALILIADLTVLQGQITKKNFEMVIKWASETGNREKLENEWSRLNER